MKLTTYLTSPLLWAVVLLLVLVAYWPRLRPRWRILGVALEFLLFAVTTPLGASALAAYAGAGARSPADCIAVPPRTVVVLSGGITRPPRGANDYGALGLASLQRLFSAVALWRELPGARLIVSGGGAGVPEGVLMANLALRMDVPVDDVRVEAASMSTWQNAEGVANLAPSTPRRIWLVTSGPHMPRALRAFRAFGFEACAWTRGLAETDPGRGAGILVPQGWAAARAGEALHELVGNAAYAVRAAWHARGRQAPQTP